MNAQTLEAAGCPHCQPLLSPPDTLCVWYRCKYNEKGEIVFRAKTGKDCWVPLENGLADKLRAWQQKVGHRKYVFGTKDDKIEGHSLRLMKHYAKLSGQDPSRWWLHKCRDTFASWCLRRKIDLIQFRHGSDTSQLQ